MDQDYDVIVENMSQQVFSEMKPRVSAHDLERIKDAFLLAKEAHAPQRRKSGEPYIIHPISVALIAARELRLDANSVITAFLHDVVEDTPYTTEDIRHRFGDDVANLVDIVTKKKKEQYNTTKQVDNYQQILDSLHYDIRAVMVKISDRLHNMRTLASMRPDKQMKIAGETDYFYAPLANRLGLFDVKSDLENLSFKYRCGLLYNDLENFIEQDRAVTEISVDAFCKEIKGVLKDHGIQCKVERFYRRPYSIWRRMNEQDVDFHHVPNKYYVRITFWEDTIDNLLTDKDICLKIYSLLTREFRERPGYFINNIDNSKENSYQCLRLMLLSPQGIWEDIQICSEEMVEASRVGCLGELGNNIGNWVKRFRKVLEDISLQGNEEHFLEHISSSLYYDDISVFSPDGTKMILPKDSTVLDFAFRQNEKKGMTAHYAKVNGKLSSVKTVLKNGDCVQLFTSPDAHPQTDWIDHCQTYAAKRNLRIFMAERLVARKGVERCPICKPLPGGEIIGIRTSGTDTDQYTDIRRIVIHRRSCPEAIRLASKYGDNVVNVDFTAFGNVIEEEEGKICKQGTSYPVTFQIKAVDRYHLLSDLVAEISDSLGLVIDSLHTTTTDCIVDCEVTFMVHSVQELVYAIGRISQLDGVDSVHQKL